MTPERCPYCGSERKGVAEKKVYFGCGTVGQEIKPKPRVRRTTECVDRNSFRADILQSSLEAWIEGKVFD